MNHPAGRIGKRLTVKVDDVMRPREECGLCGPGDILIDVIGVMSAKRCGCLLVCEEPGNTLVGIFTDGDLRRAIEREGADALKKPMRDMMKHSPATCAPGAMAYNAMLEMERREDSQQKKRVKELPIVDESKQVIGLVTLHDIVRFGL